MSYPKVSVIVPSYNHQSYINYALDSIVADDYPNKEIVIINDGSTDASDNVISEWVQKNKQHIPVNYLHRKNKGLTATLNELVTRAKGKYIIILASDDILHGNTITKRVELLEQNEAKGKLVLVSDALVIDGSNNVIMQSSMAEYNSGNKLKYSTDDGIMEEVILNPSISGATVMINKKMYDIIGPYAEDLKAEDWFFYQRAAAEKAILFWDSPVSLYRVHLENTSGLAAPIERQLSLIDTIIKTFYRNFSRFPSTKYKLLALRQLLKYILVYNKLKLKRMLK